MHVEHGSGVDHVSAEVRLSGDTVIQLSDRPIAGTTTATSTQSKTAPQARSSPPFTPPPMDSAERWFCAAAEFLQLRNGDRQNLLHQRAQQPHALEGSAKHCRHRRQQRLHQSASAVVLMREHIPSSQYDIQVHKINYSPDGSIAPTAKAPSITTVRGRVEAGDPSDVRLNVHHPGSACSTTLSGMDSQRAIT